VDEPLRRRRAVLETLMAGIARSSRLLLSPVTREAEGAERWLAQAGRGAVDGLVAKRLDDPYRPGRTRHGQSQAAPHRPAVAINSFRFGINGMPRSGEDSPR
jgi:hypothetical protein